MNGTENCKIIYEPKGQAREYAELATNPYRGCGHKCVYCYVPAALRMRRNDFDNEVRSRKNYLPNLRKDAEKYHAANIRKQVLLSFTTDVYNPTNTSLTRPTIEVLQEYGLGVCILTKGGTRALADFDLFRPGRDSFAVTLTSLDDRISKRWEPEAALPRDRIAALQAFHSAGISTWVSLEPVYDVEATLQIIRSTYNIVDLYKVGRINYHRLTKETNWQKFTDLVVSTLDTFGCNYYIKKDLQPYLRYVEMTQ